MEASALSQAGRRGLLSRKSRLLRLQGDEKLIAMVREGNSGAFEIIVDRYQGRLLGFCRQMLRSNEDAEDVLQEVFVNAFKAMVADNREINLRPWLYRIARNRCLNHLRKPTADSRESMDMVPAVEQASTAETVHNREEFRQLLTDVSKLPETQRSALLLREMDGLSYEEIAETMDTTVPSVKSLLVRARMSLSEASEARMLTCGEVRLSLAEAAEGISKASGPVRRHVRDCEECASFRKQLRTDSKALAAIFPAGPLLALKAFLIAKIGGIGGGAAASGGAGACAAGGGTVAAGAAGTCVATSAAAGSAAAVAGGAAAASGAAAGIAGAAALSAGGTMGSALGLKAVAGVVTAAVITAGAVEVKKHDVEPVPVAPVSAKIRHAGNNHGGVSAAAARLSKPAAAVAAAVPAPTAAEAATSEEATSSSAAPEVPVEPTTTVPPPAEVSDPAVSDPALVKHPAGTSNGNANPSLGGNGTPVVPADPGSVVIASPAPSSPSTATPPPVEPPPVAPPPVDPPPVAPPPVTPPPVTPPPVVVDPPVTPPAVTPPANKPVSPPATPAP